MMAKSFLAFALASTTFAAGAQTVPNGGRILQQVAPPENSAPTATPELAIERTNPLSAPDTTAFPISRIVIEGNRAFNGATLHALVAADEGSSLTLAQLDALAARITAYYRDHDYPLARAIIPAQILDGGTVRISVIEAHYDAVRLTNRSRANDGLLQAMLAPLKPGQAITQRSLDRALRLLAEIPGVIPRATLSAGNAIGTSILSVQVDPGPAMAGTITLDNAGNAYTGRVRTGVWLNVQNPLRYGDLISIGAITSGKGLAYGRLGYQAIINGHGTQLGAAYSFLDYDLGGELGALQAHGTAAVASGWAVQPLIRSRRGTLDARLQFDYKRLRDRIDAADLRGDRHTSSWTLSLDGNSQDSSGLNSAEVSITHGRLGFDDAVAAAADAATARVAGSYARVNASVERIQVLAARTRLSLSVQAQWSDDNLDSSEQFQLGGPQSARAYDIGALAGASGYAATIALRQAMSQLPRGRTEASLFVDTGSLSVNAQPWNTSANRAHVYSGGVGLDWTGPNRWSGRAQFAIPLGSTPDLVGQRERARFWLQIVKGF